MKILNKPKISTRVKPIKGGKHNIHDLSIIKPKLLNNFISPKAESDKEWSPANVIKIPGKPKSDKPEYVRGKATDHCAFETILEMDVIPPRRSGNKQQINYNKKGE